jgi:hypothetical protein
MVRRVFFAFKQQLDQGDPTIIVTNQTAKSTASAVVFTVQRSAGPAMVLVVCVAHGMGMP